jgi:hypothetical protein
MLETSRQSLKPGAFGGLGEFFFRASMLFQPQPRECWAGIAMARYPRAVGWTSKVI